jgi:uncharacterized protein (DUF58 family)
MTEDDAVPAATLARLAWQAWARGDAVAARTLARAATAAARGQPRRERQLAQIVELAVDGDTGRASGLTAEHLAEFPNDQLIGRIQAWMSGRRRGPQGSAEPDGT